MVDAHDQIRRFMIAFNKIDSLYYEAIERMGMKGSFFFLFYALADGRVYSQRQICDDWSLPRTTLNTIVRECVQKGLIQLIPRGNKEKDIVLTHKGRTVVDEIFVPLFAAEAEAMKPYLEAGILDTMESLASRFKASFDQLRR